MEIQSSSQEMIFAAFGNVEIWIGSTTVDDSSIDNVDFKAFWRPTVDGEWCLPEEREAERKEKEEQMDEDEDEEETQHDHIYMFEGKDYSKETTDQDKDAFDRLLADNVTKQDQETNTPRSRRQTGSTSVFQELTVPSRKRKELTEEEKEERRKKRQESAAKRARLQEEAEVRRAQERRRKQEELWARSNYSSSNILLDSDSGDEDEDEEEVAGVLQQEEEEEDEERQMGIQYIKGDVTYPSIKQGDAIVVHCVDDSGSWGQGGLFTALSNRSQMPEMQYELAGRMKDLALGDTHLVPIDERVSRDEGNDYVALIVAQHRDRNSSVSGIKLTALDQGLRRIYKIAKEKKASVHLPRIGHSTPGFNWYGTERLIKKHLCNRGIHSSVYYYARRTQKQTPAASQSIEVSSSEESDDPSTVTKDDSEERGKRQWSGLEDFLTDIRVHLHQDIDEDDRKKLQRYIVAYPYLDYQSLLNTYNGEVERQVSARTTHLISQNGVKDGDPILSGNSDMKVVKPQWIWDSIAQRKILQEDKYLV
ncbi:putative chromodomain-helicase-DNA-binding protein 1-like [Apostichopus japonicus]|uniref:Putative chromodomain-helicase-DNA-binding protein 1-like n=1 Tax=Stichopus japonicus TaxID=307972 RepID=A0A2G8JQD8_STIJA|nr:putative chromodomain-helicase-DNA-binding protein 1-like [Apostichopus japonicus]